MKTTNILSRLDRIDWDFPGSQTVPLSVHALHVFPGNFIPNIPFHLIQILTKVGDIVFDPFCGSGTTGIEAVRLKRISIQSDINRVGLLMTNAKFFALYKKDILGVLKHLNNNLAISRFHISLAGELTKELNTFHNWFDGG